MYLGALITQMSSMQVPVLFKNPVKRSKICFRTIWSRPHKINNSLTVAMMYLWG